MPTEEKPTKAQTISEEVKWYQFTLGFDKEQRLLVKTTPTAVRLQSPEVQNRAGVYLVVFAFVGLAAVLAQLLFRPNILYFATITSAAYCLGPIVRQLVLHRDSIVVDSKRRTVLYQGTSLLGQSPQILRVRPSDTLDKLDLIVGDGVDEVYVARRVSPDQMAEIAPAVAERLGLPLISEQFYQASPDTQRLAVGVD